MAPYGNDDAVRDRDVLNPAVRQARAAEQKRLRGGAAAEDPRRRGRNDQHAGLPFGRCQSWRGETSARNSEPAVSPAPRSRGRIRDREQGSSLPGLGGRSSFRASGVRGIALGVRDEDHIASMNGK